MRKPNISNTLKRKLLFILVIFSSIIFYSCKSTPETEKPVIENPENPEEPETPEESENSEETEKTENTTEENEEQKPENTEESEAPESENTEESSTEAEEVPHLISRKLLDQGKLTATQLAEYFLSQRPDYDLIEIVHFAQIYIVEAAEEGINSDVAFAQMCLETGYLRFGGLVQPEFHNYCGLGAMDAEHPGCIFENEQLGIRAHIQHLQAYATTEDVQLHNELIDPRYSWVHKTKYVENIDGLTGTWATDPEYSNKINNILNRMEQLLVK